MFPVSPARRRALGAFAAAVLPIRRAASAAAYPDKPSHLVVPFAAGGGADHLARMVAPRIAQELGTTIVIDNRPGAGGGLGAEQVARAAPDGYTLLYGTNGTHGINASLYASLRYDPIVHFVPVGRLTQIAALLTVTPSLPVRSVEELVRHARAHPRKVYFASAGNGTTSHLAGELFRTAAGVEIVHVPYRGGALAATDVAGGQVQMLIDVMPNVLPLARAGRLRGLAVTTARRFPTAPEFPTLAESGLAGFEVSAWDGILAPAGTPAPVVERLNGAIRAALDDPQVRTALLAHGAQPVPGTPEDFARLIPLELDKWGRAVRQSGAKVD